MKKSTITIIVIILLITVFGVLYIFSWNFHSWINYTVESTIWKIRNCELKNHNEIMKESTLILIPRNDEEYELFLETAERLKQEEPAIDASPPKDVKIASLNDELYDRTYKKYILDNKCSNGKKPKIVYQHHSGPFVMDGGSITYYYCKAEDETFIASFSGLAQVWEYYLYQGNICKT